MSQPRVALCQLSYPDTSFSQDVDNARATGASGVTISQTKVVAGEEPAQRAELERAGLAAALAVPAVWTLLPPLGGHFPAVPADPRERVGAMAAAMPSLGQFGPASVLICTGPAGDLGEREAREVVVAGMRVLATAAEQAGTRLSLEPMRESFRPIRTIVSSLAETLELLDEVGRDGVGIVFDLWHSWDSPRVHEVLPQALPHLHGVQVADYREPTRGPMDRVVAGDGVIDIPRFLRELRALGFDGWYDLELFSDDGRFGAAYEDSLWKLDPLELAQRQMSGFLASWEASQAREA